MTKRGFFGRTVRQVKLRTRACIRKRLEKTKRTGRPVKRRRMNLDPALSVINTINKVFPEAGAVLKKEMDLFPGLYPLLRQHGENAVYSNGEVPKITGNYAADQQLYNSCKKISAWVATVNSRLRDLNETRIHHRRTPFEQGTKLAMLRARIEAIESVENTINDEKILIRKILIKGILEKKEEAIKKGIEWKEPFKVQTQKYKNILPADALRLYLNESLLPTMIPKLARVWRGLMQAESVPSNEKIPKITGNPEKDWKIGDSAQRIFRLQNQIQQEVVDATNTRSPREREEHLKIAAMNEQKINAHKRALRYELIANLWQA